MAGEKEHSAAASGPAIEDTCKGTIANCYIICIILLMCVLHMHLEGNDSDVDSIQTKDHDSSAQTTEESTTDGTSVSSAPSATQLIHGKVHAQHVL